MNGYTQCVVLGRITRDVEVKFVGDEGTPLCEFSVAINRKYRNKEEVQFFDVQMWGDRVESFIQFHGKGSPCMIIGELNQQRWNDKETGKPRTRVCVKAHTWVMLPKGQSRSTDEPDRKADRTNEADYDDTQPGSRQTSFADNKRAAADVMDEETPF